MAGNISFALALEFLLLPAADRGGARAAFERLTPPWNRALCRALRIEEPAEKCPRHRRRAA